MARIVPSDIGALFLAGASEHEIETLRRLRDELPVEYTVFHGVHWSRERSQWCLFGEIDFAVVNQAGHVLVIEQKNGALEESADGLVKHYGRDSKNVVTQLYRSMDALRDKYKPLRGSGQSLHLDYLIYIPDHRFVGANAPGIDRSRVVDAADATQLASRIQTILPTGDATQAADRERVIDFFAQTLRLVPDVSAHVGAQDRAFTALTNSLAETIRRLEFEPFRLRVIGAAGAGKSQLSLDFCQRVLEAGRRPLLVCFNRPLAEKIRVLAPAEAECDTYHGFLYRFLSTHGEPPDLDRLGQSSELWREVQEKVIAMSVPPEWRFDALIVDEGQDFLLEWYEILQLFLTKDATVLWLEDPEQNIYGKVSVPLPSFVTYRDGRNFRTPQTIARFIERTLGVAVDARNPTPGLGVDVHSYRTQSEQPGLVAHRITDLVRQGFRHEDIVVVSCIGRDRSAFRDVERLGSLPLRRFTGEYGPDGQQIYTDGKVTWDTLYRFKGQQAPAVILVDVEPQRDEDRMRRLLYCGMTRPTVRLELVVSDQHPLLGTFRHHV